MSQFDGLDKLQEKFSGKYPGEASGVAELDANVRIPADQAFSTGGSDTHKAAGVINSQFAPVGNVGGGEQDLMSYTLPANTLDADGKAIRVIAWGTAIVSGKTVAIKFRFGSSSYFIVNSGVSGKWHGEFTIIRTGSSAQNLKVIGIEGDAAPPVTEVSIAIDSQAMGSSIVIGCRGENLTDAVDNAVTQHGMLVEILN